MDTNQAAGNDAGQRHINKHSYSTMDQRLRLQLKLLIRQGLTRCHLISLLLWRPRMSKAAELAALIGSQTALSNRNLIINGA